MHVLPSSAWVFSGCSNFLSQCQNMHNSLTGDSKLATKVNVSECCVCPASDWRRVRGVFLPRPRSSLSLLSFFSSYMVMQEKPSQNQQDCVYILMQNLCLCDPLLSFIIFFISTFIYLTICIAAYFSVMACFTDPNELVHSGFHKHRHAFSVSFSMLLSFQPSHKETNRPAVSQLHYSAYLSALQ